MDEKISFIVINDTDHKKYRIMLKSAYLAQVKVSNLKKNISTVTGVPESDQILTFQNRILQDHETGSSIGLFNDCKLNLTRSTSMRESILQENSWKNNNELSASPLTNGYETPQIKKTQNSSISSINQETLNELNKNRINNLSKPQIENDNNKKFSIKKDSNIELMNDNINDFARKLANLGLDIDFDVTNPINNEAKKGPGLPYITNDKMNFKLNSNISEEISKISINLENKPNNIKKANVSNIDFITDKEQNKYKILTNHNETNNNNKTKNISTITTNLKSTTDEMKRIEEQMLLLQKEMDTAQRSKSEGKNNIHYEQKQQNQINENSYNTDQSNTQNDLYEKDNNKNNEINKIKENAEKNKIENKLENQKKQLKDIIEKATIVNASVKQMDHKQVMPQNSNIKPNQPKYNNDYNNNTNLLEEELSQQLSNQNIVNEISKNTEDMQYFSDSDTSEENETIDFLNIDKIDISDPEQIISLLKAQSQMVQRIQRNCNKKIKKMKNQVRSLSASIVRGSNQQSMLSSVANASILGVSGNGMSDLPPSMYNSTVLKRNDISNLSSDFYSNKGLNQIQNEEIKNESFLIQEQKFQEHNKRQQTLIDKLRQKLQKEQATLDASLNALKTTIEIEKSYDDELAICNYFKKDLDITLHQLKNSVDTKKFSPQLIEAATMMAKKNIVDATVNKLIKQLEHESKFRKTLHNTLEDLKGGIRVVVRIRPLLTVSEIVNLLINLSIFVNQSGDGDIQQLSSEDQKSYAICDQSGSATMTNSIAMLLMVDHVRCTGSKTGIYVSQDIVQKVKKAVLALNNNEISILNEILCPLKISPVDDQVLYVNTQTIQSSLSQAEGEILLKHILSVLLNSEPDNTRNVVINAISTILEKRTTNRTNPRPIYCSRSRFIGFFSLQAALYSLMAYDKKRQGENTALDKATQEQNNTAIEQSLQGMAKYDFFKIYGYDSTQSTIFQNVSPLLRSAIDGYNICIIAYGATSAGKTFTIYGDDTLSDGSNIGKVDESNNSNENDPDTVMNRLGIVPRAIAELYQHLYNLGKNYVFTVKCAMVELYLNTLLDLFSPNFNPNIADGNNLSSFGTTIANNNLDSLQIRHNTDGTTYIQNLTYVDANSAEDVISLLGNGLQKRHVAATKMNIVSSRSHTIFITSVTMREIHTNTIQTSNITFADLAGSERVSKSMSTGTRFKETQTINMSLSALGDVISALSKHEDFIPYRNNKLTLLLQPSLGGDSKTLLFANICPHPSLLNETLSTLTFASRVKTIKNVAVCNVIRIDSWSDITNNTTNNNNETTNANNDTSINSISSRSNSTYKTRVRKH